MPTTIEQQIDELENGPVHRFGDWPATHFDIGPSGVYTVWRTEEFLYVGMSYVQRGETANVQAKGVFGRLASHASGRRSGDQFCIYICDRFVVPRLSSGDLTALATGQRILDGRTREFIRDELSYRVVLTMSGNEARTLETKVRTGGLPSAGRPVINP